MEPAGQDGEVWDPAKLQVYRVTATGTTGSKEVPVRTYDEHLLTARSSADKFRSVVENKRERNIDRFAATGMRHGDNARDHELKSREGKEHIRRTLSCCSQRPAAAGALRCEPADPLVAVLHLCHPYFFINRECNQKGYNKKSSEVLSGVPGIEVGRLCVPTGGSRISPFHSLPHRLRHDLRLLRPASLLFNESAEL